METSSVRLQALLGLCFLLYSLSTVVSQAGEPAIVVIAAQPDHLVFQLDGSAAAVRIVELRPYQTYVPACTGAVAWEGQSPNRAVTIPRLVAGRDRLYSKFQLADKTTGRALGSVRWVTDLDALPAWHFAMPWPKSKKCISCPVDIDDLKVLGARYADDGFVLAALFDWSPGPWKETWEVDGQVIGINLDCVHDLDRRVKRMSELGMNMTLIPINGVPTEPAPANPLIHPRTDLAHAPYHLGAFNLIDNMATAHVTNCLAWRPGWADGHGGLLYPTILQHPLAPNKGLGEAVYRVELPGPKAGTALILRFGTTITGPTDDGVRMSVAVNGKELWSETQVRKGQPHQGMVDLSAYAGQSIRLALRVDARGNNAGDWSNWLRPVILAEVKGEGRQ